MATGEWGIVRFEVPDVFEDARDAINDFAQLLLAFLEIANIILEFAKTFLRAFLDPLAALIQLILDEILALLRDLKQIGLYVTGDYNLLGWPPENLKGGFAGYERRMMARLLDRTDPTRPEVSSRTKVLAFFAYLSVDVSDFEQLIRFVVNILRLFGLSFFPDTSRLPLPNIRSIRYAIDAVGVSTDFNFSALGDVLTSSDGTPPSKARVTWTLQHPSQKHPLNPFPTLGPSGFIVTVSVFEEGLTLQYARVTANADRIGDAQRRDYGNVLSKDLQPVVLHGGAEMLAIRGSRYEYNKAISDGSPKDGSSQVFAVLDAASNEIIPLEELHAQTPTSLGVIGDGKGSEFLLQRTFLINSPTAAAQWFAGEYHAVLDLDDMPQLARFERNSDGKMEVLKDGPSSHYYVRVWSVGEGISERGDMPQWDLTSPQAVPLGDTPSASFILEMKSGQSSVSRPSGARKITFANAFTKEYLNALQTALLVLYLSRSDMPYLDELESLKGVDAADALRNARAFTQGVALRETGLESSRSLISLLGTFKNSSEASEWRTALYNRIKTVARDIYESTGPMPDFERSVVENTEELRAMTWVDVLSSVGQPTLARIYGRLVGDNPPTLFEALGPNATDPFTFGACPNISSMDMDPSLAQEIFSMPSLLLGRREEFLVWDQDPMEVSFASDDSHEVEHLIEDAPDALREFYLKFIQPDGTLSVPEGYREMLTDVLNRGYVSSSGDDTPIFMAGQGSLLDSLDTGVPDEDGVVVFMRYALRVAQVDLSQEGQGPLYEQSAIALAAAASFTRPPEDGEWIALRLFDSFPELEEFLLTIENWVRAIAQALSSMADAIAAYIQFVQDQIVELQQLIQRINAFLQSLLSFSFSLPRFSGLTLLSDGTDGVVADLVTATNKPSDSPLSYGGGVCVVVPFGPSFLVDLIQVASGDALPFDPNSSTEVDRPPRAVGVEDVPRLEEEDDDIIDVL